MQRKLSAALLALDVPAGEIERSVPVISYLLGALPADSLLHSMEPEQLKRQLFRAARQLFELQLQQGPLLLMVDDLHWADVASLELLRFLLESLGERQFALLLAHRLAVDAGSLGTGSATYTAIRLGPLSADHSAALLEAFFGPAGRSFPARLRALIVKRTGGNPFYLEEVVRGLIDSGVLRRVQEHWVCNADVATLDVPPTVQAVLLARLDRLPAAVRRLAQEAAVLGTTFDESLLRGVCSAPDSVPAHLAALHAAGLLEASAPAGPAGIQPYHFPHALVQDVAYQSLLVRRRTELHGQAGRALECLHGDRPERLADLEALGRHSA